MEARGTEGGGTGGPAPEASGRRGGPDPAGPVRADAETAVSVLHVLDTQEFAGRESVVEKLAGGQLSAGHDVRVLAVVEEGAGDPPFLHAARGAEIPLDVLRLPPRAYLEERKRLVAACREHRPDVLHTHGYRPDVIGGSAAAAAGVPSVSTVHGFTGGGWKNRLYERLQRLCLRRFDAVVAVSAALAEELERSGVPPSRLHVIRNAWGGRDDFLPKPEARRELSVEEDAFLAGWVGRVSPEKGPDVLVDALERVRLSGVTVSVIGDGPERAPLSRRAEALPEGREVRWHGSVPSAYRLFRAFDVFVLSSRSEGTPMVLLEAMAAGVPVVATSVGGVPDVVSRDEAYLVPPEDPDALADAVARVRDRPEEAARRVEAARRRLEAEFGPEAWVARYAGVYRSVRRSREGKGGT